MKSMKMSLFILQKTDLDDIFDSTVHLAQIFISTVSFKAKEISLVRKLQFPNWSII